MSGEIKMISHRLIAFVDGVGIVFFKAGGERTSSLTNIQHLACRTGDHIHDVFSITCTMCFFYVERSLWALHAGRLADEGAGFAFGIVTRESAWRFLLG